MLTLLTGPVRSGKSTFALELARESDRRPVYVATLRADPADAEMRDRVARHRSERDGVRTVETDEGLGPSLAATIRGFAGDEIAIVDSLGTWLSGLLIADPPADVDARAADLLAALSATAADVVVVAEETGWGVVPPTPLGRRFRDDLGRLTAELAGCADRAYLVVAGYAVDLRAAGRRVSAGAARRRAR
jgi:adenosylcobinamide kinase/adenosylcobinamide-phosphate guanylyltransferase